MWKSDKTERVRCLNICVVYLTPYGINLKRVSYGAQGVFPWCDNGKFLTGVQLVFFFCSGVIRPPPPPKKKKKKKNTGALNLIKPLELRPALRKHAQTICRDFFSKAKLNSYLEKKIFEINNFAQHINCEYTLKPHPRGGSKECQCHPEC